MVIECVLKAPKGGLIPSPCDSRNQAEVGEVSVAAKRRDTDVRITHQAERKSMVVRIGILVKFKSRSQRLGDIERFSIGVQSNCYRAVWTRSKVSNVSRGQGV